MARLDPAAEPHNRPVSRLAGSDWGPAQPLADRAGRLLANRQADHAAGVPVGGSDQNTYLIFEEPVSAGEWQSHGLQLRMELFFTGGAEVNLEFRDPRRDGLRFRRDAALPALSGSGWKEFRLPIEPRLIGRPLPRHYHRLHVELLGSLLQRHPDPALQEVLHRWQAADRSAIPCPAGPAAPRPRDVHVLVNAGGRP